MRWLASSSSQLLHCVLINFLFALFFNGFVFFRESILTELGFDNAVAMSAIVALTLAGLAANIIAKYVERYRWIAWGCLLVILWVALKMIWEGAHHVAPYIAPVFS